jgi:hypothetical protein
MAEIRRAAAETERAIRTETLPGTGAAPPAKGPTRPSFDGEELVRPTIPKGCTINIVCLPAHDEADEIVNLMLAQLLELRGYCSFSLSQSALASEMVEEVEKRNADVVIISALPPSAVAHSRYLCKRVHARFPDARMIVGLWLVKGDVKKLRDRITCVADVQIATTLMSMQEQIHQIVQPLVAQRMAPAEPANRA